MSCINYSRSKKTFTVGKRFTIFQANPFLPDEDQVFGWNSVNTFIKRKLFYLLMYWCKQFNYYFQLEYAYQKNGYPWKASGWATNKTLLFMMVLASSVSTVVAMRCKLGLGSRTSQPIRLPHALAFILHVVWTLTAFIENAAVTHLLLRDFLILFDVSVIKSISSEVS